MPGRGRPPRLVDLTALPVTTSEARWSLRSVLPRPLRLPTVLGMVLPIVLAYGAELAQFTFAFDYWATIRYQTQFSNDGRFLGDLIQVLTFHSTVPFPST